MRELLKFTSLEILIIMYRHEKTPENTTALEGVIQGFAEEPSSIFQNEMRKVAEEMKDLPFYRKSIDCYCPKFILFENQWIGTVVTPWMLSIVILPGKDQEWESHEIGDKLSVQLPYKTFTFTVSSLENIPQYLSCSLCCRPRILRNITVKSEKSEILAVSHFKRLKIAKFEK